MPTLQVRNLLQEIYDRLKAEQENYKRFMAQQAIVLLEEALNSKLVDRSRHIEEIQHINAQNAHLEGVTQNQFVQLKRKDRDR